MSYQQFEYFHGTATYPEAKKNGTPASPATARANKVFPVPGGLY